VCTYFSVEFQIIMKELVVKSNALNSAGYTINLVAQRVVLLAIIKARNSGTLIKAGGILRITAEDYRKYFVCDRSTSYSSLKSACESLYEADFLWIDNDEKDRKKFNKSRFVQRASYVDQGSYIEVMFGNDVIPLITRLSEQYTEYELAQIKDLNSIYALRIFELVMQWSGARITPVIKLEDLRARLGIEEEQYKLMSNFKKRVLDYAVKEINDNTNITVEYEQKKHGRTIIGFIFKFKTKKAAEKKAIKAPAPVVNNADMYTIDNLSDAQLSRITRSPQFIRDFSDLIAPTSSINKDMNAWSIEFVKRIKQDHTLFNKKRPIKEYLEY